jgi:uncharacterized membrane protein
MDMMTLARALHVLAVVHWIGGVAMVTLVLLPGLIRAVPGPERLRLFEMIEGRFGAQAKLSTLLAGGTGLWMTWELDAWTRFSDPASWWMTAMFGLWLVFTLVLFVAEPLFLHRWFHARSQRNPEGTFALVLRFHRVLLVLSMVTVLGAVLGAHGAI